MRELTPGELRYIEESTNGWQMYIYSKSQMMTPELEQRMRELSDAYKDAFYAFYEAALQQSEVIDCEAVHRDFDEAYGKDHPEYYDVEALLGGRLSC